jgi:hypothetical protein
MTYRSYDDGLWLFNSLLVGFILFINTASTLRALHGMGTSGLLKFILRLGPVDVFLEDRFSVDLLKLSLEVL